MLNLKPLLLKFAPDLFIYQLYLCYIKCQRKQTSRTLICFKSFSTYQRPFQNILIQQTYLKYSFINIKQLTNKKRSRMASGSEKVLKIASNQNKLNTQSIQLHEEPNHHSLSKQKISYIDHINTFAKNNAIDLVRFLFCILFGAFIASSYFNISPDYPSSSVLASSQILVSKGIKGIFPPLSGVKTDLYGRWHIGLINSQGDNMTFHQKYSIQFKKSNTLFVTNADCKSKIKLNWYSFSYNIFLRQIEQMDSELKIENEKEDVECIEEDMRLWELLRNITIWTVHEKRLYFISQVQGKQNKLIILERAKK